MRVKLPLSIKILCLFLLNIIFLGAVFFAVARWQFHFGMDSLITGPMGDRMQSLADVLVGELKDRPIRSWDAVLERFSEAYHVRFRLFTEREQIAGSAVNLPDEVKKIVEKKPQSGGPGSPGGLDERGMPPPGMDDFGPPPGGREPHGPPLRLAKKELIHAGSPGRYWVVMPVFLPLDEMRPRPVMLVVESESLSGGGLFFDLRLWVMGGAAVVLISVLFWIPLVAGITGAVSRMTRATGQIAEGRFDVRTQVKRRDELGALSESIDQMAVRLSGYVTGQKRFLGDIAHELCSPIARMQVALGILEQRGDEKLKAQLADLGEEVQLMSSLVNELLSFSKASLGGKAVQLKPVSLREVVEKAVARECGPGSGAETKIEAMDGLLVMAEPELLGRAIGNVLRNAARYAGSAGAITIRGERGPDGVLLRVEDCGPGIPAESIAKIFDPFYRVDASRDRETGGAGLGLAIVKTCVESCGGTVTCENRQPHGLCVTMKLTGV
jgi:two-component system sensor histidine kinase CpxA